MNDWGFHRIFLAGYFWSVEPTLDNMLASIAIAFLAAAIKKAVCFLAGCFKTTLIVCMLEFSYPGTPKPRETPSEITLYLT